MNKKKSNQEILDTFDYLSCAASLTDCTGLIPTPAYTPEERESYEEIYHFLPLQNIKKDAD